MALTAPRLQDEPPLVLSPAQYYNYTQPTGNHIPYLNQAPGYIKPVWNQDATPEDIVQTFRLPSGVGATCCLKTPYNSSFDAAILKQLNFTYRYWFVSCIFPKALCSNMTPKNMWKAQIVSTNIMWFVVAKSFGILGSSLLSHLFSIKKRLSGPDSYSYIFHGMCFSTFVQYDWN